MGPGRKEKPEPLKPENLLPFLDFARQAVFGKRRMLITHTEIFPATFANTIETADYLLEQLEIERV